MQTIMDARGQDMSLDDMVASNLLQQDNFKYFILKPKLTGLDYDADLVVNKERDLDTPTLRPQTCRSTFK